MITALVIVVAVLLSWWFSYTREKEAMLIWRAQQDWARQRDEARDRHDEMLRQKERQRLGLPDDSSRFG